MKVIFLKRTTEAEWGRVFGAEDHLCEGGRVSSIGKLRRRRMGERICGSYSMGGVGRVETRTRA